MKGMIIVALVALGAGVGQAHEGHGQQAGKDITVKGELVDMACFMAHEGKGKDHAECAKMCVQSGAPLGLLANDGKVYLLLEDHSSPKAKKPYAEAKEMVADNVTVKGDIYERGGLHAIVVESVVSK